jgi:biofilm PGA synthesis N-glycosyltransferase PgaC
MTMQPTDHGASSLKPRASSLSRRYVLITPCRNEADYLQTTIDAVAAQTVPPAKWIVVDDGSTDATPEILAAAAKRMPYLQVTARPDRGTRSVGPGVIEAFYAGLEHVDLDDYDYVCKFDADLDLTPRYFERLIEHCEEDPWLGTVSGKLFLRYGDRLVEERCGDENSVGPTKFYRSDCFRDIGGFVRQVSWDGIDGHCCRMKGWVARSIDEPDLQIIHLRRMGSSHKSFWTGRLRWGRGKYFMGSRMSYVLAVSAYRMFERPWVLSGLGILCGYLQACMQRPERHDDPAYLRWLRKYELESLFRGKRRTMRRWHEHVRQTFPARPVASSAAPRERAA